MKRFRNLAYLIKWTSAEFRFAVPSRLVVPAPKESQGTSTGCARPLFNRQSSPFPSGESQPGQEPAVQVQIHEQGSRPLVAASLEQRWQHPCRRLAPGIKCMREAKPTCGTLNQSRAERRLCTVDLLQGKMLTRVVAALEAFARSHRSAGMTATGVQEASD